MMEFEPIKKELDKINVVDLGPDAYFQASIDNEPDKTKNPGTGCYGWKYLEGNITLFLKELLKQEAYWNLKYNAEKVDFVTDRIGILSPELKRQLEAFVYIYNRKKSDAEDRARRQAILARGFEEITDDRKDLDKVKVRGIFEISKIGILGSFDVLEEQEGTLHWSIRDAKGNGCLMLIPKGRRTRGYLIKDRAYIKRC